MWALGALAAGLGLRAVARGFEVAPHTVLQGLGDLADHATAFAHYCLPAVRVTQGQLDALCARLSAGKAGAGSEAEALTRLARAPQGIWAALAPGTTRLLPSDGGARTLARAQRLGHQVVPVLAPGGLPLCLTDGFTA